MNSYQVKHILPNKALLLSLGCLLPFAALGIYLESEMQTSKIKTAIPFFLGAGLAYYFIMFYVEGIKVIHLFNDSIITDGSTIKIESISSFKLKDDSSEFIYLKIFTTDGQNLSIGTRTSDNVELLKLYEDLKKAVNNHNKDSIHQIVEKKLIYDSHWGKLIGVAIIALMVFAVYNRFFTDYYTNSLGGLLVMLSCGAFLLFRIFGKNKK
jgi:hypothetical protein